MLVIFLHSCKDIASSGSVQELDKNSTLSITYSEYWNYIRSNTNIGDQKLVEVRGARNRYLKSVEKLKSSGSWVGKKNSKLRKKTISAYNNELKSLLGDENFEDFQIANLSWKNQR